PSVYVWCSTFSVAYSVNRRGGTSSAGSVPPSAAGSWPPPSGSIVTMYGGSPGRVRGTRSVNESVPRGVSATDCAENRSAGPPGNRAGRVTRTSAPIESVLQLWFALAQYASTRPLIVTGASSWISPSQPSAGSSSGASSVAIRSSRVAG